MKKIIHDQSLYTDLYVFEHTNRNKVDSILQYLNIFKLRIEKMLFIADSLVNNINTQDNIEIQNKLNLARTWFNANIDKWYDTLVYKLIKKRLSAENIKRIIVSINSLDAISVSLLEKPHSGIRIDEILTWVMEAPMILEGNLHLDEISDIYLEINKPTQYTVEDNELTFSLVPLERENMKYNKVS